MTTEEAFRLGVDEGRKQMREELIALLGLDDLIYKAIEIHTEQYHDD